MSSTNLFFMKQKNKKEIFHSERGVSLYLAVLLMGIILAIALGLTTIALNQLKMIRGLGDSVVAFYAADTGVEVSLYDYYKGAGIQDHSGSVGGAAYSANGFSVPPNTSDCPAPNQYYCFRSVGSYLSTRRAIEISR